MRRIVLITISGLFLALLSAIPATAEGPHTVSISISDSSVNVGQKVRITGSVVPVRVRPLMLQVKYGGSWAVVARKNTTSSGRYSFSDTPSTPRNRYYRVCKIGGSAVCSKAKLVRVEAAQPDTKPTISIGAVAKYELTTDESYDISGSTSSDLVGKRVYLQLLNNADSSWASISDPVTVQSGGSFHFLVPARQAGRDLKLRIFAPATSTTKAAHRDTNPFTVFGWYYVDDTFSAVEGTLYEGAYEVNGESFPRSVAQGRANGLNNGPSTAEINLSRDCVTFDATVGMSDEAMSESRWYTRLVGDDLELWTQSDMSVGQSFPISLDVTGILRLKFDSARTHSGSGLLVYGDARALCAF